MGYWSNKRVISASKQGEDKEWVLLRLFSNCCFRQRGLIHSEYGGGRGNWGRAGCFGTNSYPCKWSWKNISSRRGNVKFKREDLKSQEYGGKEGLTTSEDTWSINVHPVCRALIAMSMKGAWETWGDGLPRNPRVFCCVRSMSWHELPWLFTSAWSFWRYGNN